MQIEDFVVLWSPTYMQPSFSITYNLVRRIGIEPMTHSFQTVALPRTITGSLSYLLVCEFDRIRNELFNPRRYLLI